ncbi:MAG TPA: hypothetical protein PKU78_00590 [Candidatus Dojkabacteria bacterium]|nr:hypothetical protein [Candidatus Dojkabacteria bacterium]HRP50667.1 hypothetical protein [Candidatus Dojkabacteria bacterium]
MAPILSLSLRKGTKSRVPVWVLRFSFYHNPQHIIMFFSDKKIIKYIKDEIIGITPFKGEFLGSVSYEMHLGSLLFQVKPKGKYFNGGKPKEKELTPIKVKNKSYTLSPGEFIIGKTEEKIYCNSETMAIFDGKPSLAQIGLFTNISSVLVDPLTDSVITCEIYNASKFPIKLMIGQKIGQIFFSGVSN